MTGEEALIQHLQDPEKRNFAFSQLMATYQEPLYWHIRKIVIVHEDADDVLQLVFIKVWKNIESFRGDSSLKTWLYRIATNEAITQFNRNKKRSFEALDDLCNTTDYATHGSIADGGDEIQAKLQRAVAELPEKQRLVFNMKYYDELKYEEIADILGGTTGSLKASYHHAVKKIEAFLKRELNQLTVE